LDCEGQCAPPPRWAEKRQCAPSPQPCHQILGSSYKILRIQPNKDYRSNSTGTYFTAALTHVCDVATPPTPAALNFGVGLRRPCQGQTLSRRRTTRQLYSEAEQILPALSVQWQVSPRGDVPSTSSSRWPHHRAGRVTADAYVNRPAPSLKTTAWASGGPAGGRLVVACLRRWRALPHWQPKTSAWAARDPPRGRRVAACFC
jgi:hypothetical protein